MKTATPVLAFLAALSLVALACDETATGPVISTLQNDDFTGGAVTFQPGFVSGEAAAARLGPQSLAFTIRRVRFLFGGSGTAQTVTLTIYQDPGTNNPGTPIHTSSHLLTPSDAALQDIDLTAQNVAVGANTTIRIAVFFQHTSVPTVGHDGARTPGRNLIFEISSGWVTSESVSIPGDFVIRAEISTP